MLYVLHNNDSPEFEEGLIVTVADDQAVVWTVEDVKEAARKLVVSVNKIYYWRKRKRK